MTVSLFLMALASATLLGWGLIPGMQGFAQTAQINDIKKSVEETQKKTDTSINSIQATQNIILTRLIASDIENARASQCKAITEGNSAAGQGWRIRLDASLYEYRAAAQRDYAVRPCSEY